MNNWAKQGRYSCNFLCICVLGDQSAYGLCREMSKQMKLTHCVNGFIDNDEDMPEYGQLGCKGFIVLDEHHRVVSASTSAFMQVKDLAFEHVEALLNAVVAHQPLPLVCPGEYMVLEQPPKERPELKGSQGICVKVEGPSVQFAFLAGPLRGRVLQLPATAVAKLGAASGGSDCSSGGCSDGKCGPGACGPGGCAPGACEPGGCGPGACADGSCKPGDCGPGQCGPGGCGPGAKDCGQGDCGGTGGCDGSGACLDSAFVEASLDVHSVKVPSMDAEHAECIEALRELVSLRTFSALEAVLEELSSHFEHEESLFVEYGFGAHVNEQLSARKSHAEDHRRILDKIRGLLSVAASAAVPMKGVPPSFIRELLQDFHEHTSRYDAQYAEPLSAKGAK